MKKLILFSVLLFLVVSLVACAADKKPAKQTQTSVNSTSKIEVYYFHYTRRCTTCQAVETESQKAIQTLYPEQTKKGLIIFKSVNLDDKTSEDLAKKCKADGQTLLVISGSKRFDLTEQGFMYAVNKPEKLMQELKTAIDPLLK